MGGHGQGEHHIPLVRQQVGAEPEDHQDESNHRHRDEGYREAHGDDAVEQVQDVKP